MQVTSKGQVTIPQAIRERLGIRTGTEVEFELQGDEARLRVARGAATRGRALVEHMRGRAGRGARTDEVLRMTRGDE